MSILSDIGDGILKATTGTDIATLQQQATAAEQQIGLALGTMIALQAVVAVGTILLVVMAWKERHG